MPLGCRAMDTSSATQQARALSSAEVEFYAFPHGAAYGMETRITLQDVRVEVKVEATTDSFGTREASGRMGLEAASRADAAPMAAAARRTSPADTPSFRLPHGPRSRVAPGSCSKLGVCTLRPWLDQ